MANCKYKVYNVEGINSDQEYEYFELIEELKKLKTNSINKSSDIVFSLETPQDLAINLLDNIRKSVKLLRTSYSKLEGEIEIFDTPESDNYIEIHEFIDKGTKIDGKPFVTSFKLEEWKKEERQRLKETYGDNINNEQIEQQINETVSSWEQHLTEGYYLQILINLFFINRENLSIEGLQKYIETSGIFPKEFLELFNLPKMLESIVNGLTLIRSNIFRAHGGKDCKIRANVAMSSKLNGIDKELYATINLIAIDPEGVPHIYIFSTSEINTPKKDAVKKLKLDYRLGAMILMLAQHGFNVKNSSLNVCSIIREEINNEDGSKKLIRFIFDQPVDRKLEMRLDGTNRLLYGSGEIWRNLNNLIPVTINTALFSKEKTKFYTKIRTKLSKLFPTHDIYHSSESKKVTYWIRDNVRPSSHPGAYWEYTDSDGKIVYISDSTTKEENQELRQKVAKELDMQTFKATDLQSYFLNGIAKAINDNMPLTAIVPNAPAGAARILVSLGKYTTGDWEYKPLAELEGLGIACMQHKRTGLLDFIILANNKDGNLSREINLGFGTTLLGSFLRDHQTLDKVKLKASAGTVKLIELLIALDEHAEELKDWKIGELKVMNINSGETFNVLTDHILSDYRILCKTANQQTKIELLQLCFLPYIQILKNRVLSLMSCVNMNDYQVTLSKVQSYLEGVGPYDRNAIAEACMNSLLEILNTYKFMLDNKSYTEILANASDKQRQILMLARSIAEVYVFVTGDFYPVQQMLPFGTNSTNTFMNGLYLATADTIPYRNEANLTRSALVTFLTIRRRFVDFKEDFFENYVKKLWEAKGYSQSQNIILGNLRNLYLNMFRKTHDGKLDPNLVFEDPDDPTNNLTEHERVFLRKVLWIINRRRFGLEKYDEDSDKVEEEKLNAGIKWFWVPVQEAAGGSKINTDYFESNLKREFLEIVSFGQKAKSAFERSEMNVYTESEKVAMIKTRERNEIYNRYALSDSDQTERTKLLESLPFGFWETNIENIVLSYELVNIRREILNEVLPHIQIIKFLIEAWGNDAGIDTSVNIKYIENFEKQAIHNITLISDEEREYTHLVKKAKMAASFSMIVGNIVAPIRDFLEGVWKSIGIFVADTWGKHKGFGRKEFFEAYGIVLAEGLHKFAGVTVCEAINQRFGLADMDYLLMDKKAKSGKTGLFNFSDKLWWTTIAGDYINRMTIMVAKMLKDGCFYACSYDGGFKYDMERDERFKIFLSGNTRHPEYKTLKGLYITMLLEFNKAGYNLKEGDKLPEPYTPQDIINIKTFADRLYGYYDHDLRILLEKQALGAIFLQFCTYLTGSKTLWFLSPGYYETNIREQGRDSEGRLLYWQRITDADGNPALVLGITPTDEPYYPIAKSYMEGIFYTLRDFFKDANDLGIGGAWKNIMECDVKKLNIRDLGYKLMMWIILGGIVKSLLDMWRDERKKDKNPYTIKRVMEDEGFNIVYRAVNGSAATFNLVEAFGGSVIDSEPPAFAVITNGINSSIRLGKSAVTGNDFGKSFESWLYTNFAAYRSTSEIFRGIGKMSQATQNTID